MLVKILKMNRIGVRWAKHSKTKQSKFGDIYIWKEGSLMWFSAVKMKWISKMKENKAESVYSICLEGIVEFEIDCRNLFYKKEIHRCLDEKGETLYNISIFKYIPNYLLHYYSVKKKNFRIDILIGWPVQSC